jgi:hypothetical protein
MRDRRTSQSRECPQGDTTRTPRCATRSRSCIDFCGDLREPQAPRASFLFQLGCMPSLIRMRTCPLRRTSTTLRRSRRARAGRRAMGPLTVVNSGASRRVSSMIGSTRSARCPRICPRQRGSPARPKGPHRAPRGRARRLGCRRRCRRLRANHACETTSGPAPIARAAAGAPRAAHRSLDLARAPAQTGRPPSDGRRSGLAPTSSVPETIAPIELKGEQGDEELLHVSRQQRPQGCWLLLGGVSARFDHVRDVDGRHALRRGGLDRRPEERLEQP